MKRILKHTWRLIAAFLVVVALVLSATRFYMYYLETHSSLFESFVSKHLGYPVSVSQIKTGWYWFEPRVSLQNLKIYNPDRSVALMTVEQMNVGVNLLDSLVSLHFVPSLLQISGMKVSFNQEANGQWTIEGIPALKQTEHVDALKGLFQWFLSERIFNLKNIHIEWTQNNKKLSADISNLNFVKRYGRHALWGDIIIKQPEVATLHVAGSLKNSHFGLGQLEAKLYLNANQVKLPLWFQSYDIHGWHIKNGFSNVAIWADWQENQWKKIQAQVALSKTQVISPSNQPWNIQASGLLLEGNAHAQNWVFSGRVGRLILNDINLTPMPLSFAYQKQGEAQSIQLSALSLQSILSLGEKSAAINAAYLKSLKQIKLAGFFNDLYIKYFDDHWVFDAYLNDISFLPFDKVPGCKHLSGHLQYADTLGFFDLDSKNLILTFPKIFREPLLIDEALGHARWKVQDHGVIVYVPHIQGHNADGVVYGRFNLFFPDQKDASLWMSLQAYASIKQIKTKSRYLPVNVIHPDLLKWLDQSIVDGQGGEATVLINGPMDDFPFDKSQGVFRIDADLNHITLKFLPSWPAAEEIDAHAIFAGRSMVINAKQAFLGHGTLSNVIAKIPYMGDGQPVTLRIKGDVQASVTDTLALFKDIPLTPPWIKQLKNTREKGNLSGYLALQIPLDHSKRDLMVNGKVKFNDAALGTDNVWITDHLNGDLDFKQTQFSFNHLSGNLFESPATFKLTQDPNPQYNHNLIKINGAINPAVLERLLPSYLKEKITGGTDFSILAHLYQSKSGSRVPPPNNQIQWMSDLKGIRIDLPQLLIKVPGESQPLLMTLTYGMATGSDLTLKVDDVDVNLKYGENAQQYVINSKGIAGTITIPDSHASALELDLKRLNLERGKEYKIDINPADLPPMLFHSNKVILDGKDIGFVNFKINPAEHGVMINDIDIGADFFHLIGQGNWEKIGKTESTYVKGNINSNNVGDFLSQWGFSKSIHCKDAQASYSLKWPDAPMRFDIAHLSGAVDLTLRDGNFPNLGDSANREIAFGSLMSLLSFQSLTEQFKLNFKGARGKGFDFNIIKGKIIFKNGQGYPQNLYIDGPIAQITINGRVGFATQDYNLDLLITPKNVTSSLPLIATIAGGPIAGAAAWLTDKVIGSAVSSLTTFHYHVSGSWNNPQVTKM